ncbi:MAG: hypothetical protein ABI970_17865, partial [Chloroflexota bacterium]
NFRGFISYLLDEILHILRIQLRLFPSHKVSATSCKSASAFMINTLSFVILLRLDGYSNRVQRSLHEPQDK